MYDYNEKFKNSVPFFRNNIFKLTRVTKDSIYLDYENEEYEYCLCLDIDTLRERMGDLCSIDSWFDYTFYFVYLNYPIRHFFATRKSDNKQGWLMSDGKFSWYDEDEKKENN